MKYELLLTSEGRFERMCERVGINLRNEKPLRAALIVGAIAWLPLVILCIIAGSAYGDAVTIPLIKDFPPNARFLVALPLIILAQGIIAPRIRYAARQFIETGIITDEVLPEYESKIERILALRDSRIAEVIILLIAYFGAYTILRTGLPDTATTWYVNVEGGTKTITPAGYFYLFISTPLYQFFMFRWMWRYILWVSFLRGVSKMKLHLLPTHPDDCGGLGFLQLTQRVFGIIVFITSMMLASQLAGGIVYENGSFLDQKFIVIGFLLFVLALFTFPLFFFGGKLVIAKREGLLKYGAFATKYSRAFDRKWIRGENPENEPMLGSGDMQSLADLGNSYNVIQEMKPIPIGKETLIALLVPGIIPMIPLLLYEVPVKDIFDALKGLVL
jgi:hypothetical protein